MPEAKKNIAAATKAKEAIKAIEAVESEGAGIPEGEISLEEKVSGRIVKVLNEKKTNLTGPNRMDDWLYIPEVIYLNDGSTRKITRHIELAGVPKVLTADGEYLLRWCHPGRFNRHQRQGFSFIKYDDMFLNTDAFKKSTEGYVQNGDVYLMKISIDGFARMLKQKMELRASMEASTVGEVTREAEKYNTKSFEINPDGSLEFVN